MWTAPPSFTFRWRVKWRENHFTNISFEAFYVHFDCPCNIFLFGVEENVLTCCRSERPPSEQETAKKERKHKAPEAGTHSVRVWQVSLFPQVHLFNLIQLYSETCTFRSKPDVTATLQTLLNHIADTVPKTSFWPFESMEVLQCAYLYPFPSFIPTTIHWNHTHIMSLLPNDSPGIQWKPQLVTYKSDIPI